MPVATNPATYRLNSTECLSILLKSGQTLRDSYSRSSKHNADMAELTAYAPKQRRRHRCKATWDAKRAALFAEQVAAIELVLAERNALPIAA